MTTMSILPCLCGLSELALGCFHSSEACQLPNLMSLPSAVGSDPSGPYGVRLCYAPERLGHVFSRAARTDLYPFGMPATVSGFCATSVLSSRQSNSSESWTRFVGLPLPTSGHVESPSATLLRVLAGNLPASRPTLGGPNALMRPDPQGIWQIPQARGHGAVSARIAPRKARRR
jgi:hypothetical protein